MADVRYVTAALERAVGVGRRFAVAPDLPFVAGVLLGTLAVIEVMLRSDAFAPSLPSALLLAVGATMPLAFARGHLIVAAAAITIATLVTVGAYERLTGAGLVALLVVLYLLGLRRPLWMALLAVAPFVLYAVLVTLDLGGSGPALGAVVDEAVEEGPDMPVPEDESTPGDDEARAERTDYDLFPLLLAALTATAAGAGVARRSRDATAERDASHQVVADTLLAHAAQGERARIARELHDVVAHHISTISVQAETARLATPGMPVEGAERLRDIGDTARTALTEMRRLLGVLRADADAEPIRSPQPGLPQLVELVDEARQLSGASTRLIVSGQVRPVDPGIELTAYRIVQEALTNTRRHAPGAAVDVELDYADDTLGLRVRDNGPGSSAVSDSQSATGHGLLGMRERVAAAGGELRTGSTPGGGFVVAATLPAGAASQPAAVPARTAE
jgi:signal transduction histidine kinase